MPLINDISDAQYESLDGINFSKFKNFFTSPYHFKWSLNNPEKPTDDLIIGNAVHAMCLQPDKFYDKFAVAPKVDRRKTEDKLIWNEFCASSQNKSVLTPEMMDMALACSSSVKDNKFFKDIINSDPDSVFIEAGGSCDFSGSKIKGRIDLYNKSKNVILDIKTCKDMPTLSQMKYYAEDRMHYMQGFFYSEIVMQSLHLEQRPSVVFLYVHKKAPFTIGMSMFGEHYIEKARRQLSKELCRYENCRFNDAWPDIPTSIIPHVIEPKNFLDFEFEDEDDVEQ